MSDHLDTTTAEAASRPATTAGPGRRGPVLEVFGTLALGVVAFLFVGDSPFRQDLAVLTATYALLALGMYIPFIMSGGLSLAYNAYLGAGAYAVAIVGTRTEMSTVLAIPIGMAVSATIAVILGLATRRLSGFYLAGVTLLFGLAFETFLSDADPITGGAAGIPGIPQTEVFGVILTRPTIVAISILSVWVFGVLLSRLRRSPYGVAVRAKRKVPEAVEASGISVPLLVLVALGLGAGVASIGGSLYAMMNGQILPETFTLSVVFLAVFMPLLGGRQSPWGAVLGAVLVVIFTFGLTLFRSTGSLVFAVAVLLVLRLAPNGLLGFVTALAGRLSRRMSGASL